MNDNRTIRFSGRAALQNVTQIPRCKACGWVVISPNGVGVRIVDKTAGFAGLATCGRVWICPVCNAKVMAVRALEIAAALAWGESKDFLFIWGSLTVRHQKGDSLKALLKIQTAAWRAVIESRAWRESNATKVIKHAHSKRCDEKCVRKTEVLDVGYRGRVGYIRAAEITVGENGWHPHFHPIIFWRGTKQEANRFANEIIQTWVDAVRANGGDANIDGGQQLKVINANKGLQELAGYVTKSTFAHHKLALEAVWSQGKQKRSRANATAPHWSLLTDVASGLVEEVALWHELERATTGHRMITWSRGLRDLAGITSERTDEEISADELGTVHDTVAFISEQGWSTVRQYPQLMGEILTTLENGGWWALEALLTRYGVEHYQAVLQAA